MKCFFTFHPILNAPSFLHGLHKRFSMLKRLSMVGAEEDHAGGVYVVGCGKDASLIGWRQYGRITFYTHPRPLS